MGVPSRCRFKDRQGPTHDTASGDGWAASLFQPIRPLGPPGSLMSLGPLQPQLRIGGHRRVRPIAMLPGGGGVDGSRVMARASQNEAFRRLEAKSSPVGRFPVGYVILFER